MSSKKKETKVRKPKGPEESALALLAKAGWTKIVALGVKNDQVCCYHNDLPALEITGIIELTKMHVVRTYGGERREVALEITGDRK